MIQVEVLYEPIYSLQDFFVFYIIVICSLFAGLLALTTKEDRQSHLLLAAFLLMISLIVIDSVIYWHPILKYRIYQHSANWFFIFGFASLLQGPILYWYTRSLTESQLKFNRKEALHLLPAVGFPLFWLFNYGLLGDEDKFALLIDYSALIEDTGFEIVNWFRRLSVIVYGVISYKALKHYHNQLVNQYSNIELHDLSWLKLLISMFLAFWCFLLVAVVEARFVNWQLGPLFGQIEGVSLFILVNVLIFYVLKHAHAFEGIHQNFQLSVSEEKAANVPVAEIEFIQHYMTEHKPYLKPTMTLERLANQLNISPRRLSSILNSHFAKNFFEFINGYRIEEAKQLLKSVAHRGEPIQEIMRLAGFNTKSTFNALFKKATGMTPRQFRQS